MRRNPRSTREIKSDMTPMIDIVFQLLVFFLLTLQIAETEGDYNIRMPNHSPGGSAAHQLPPLQVRLAAGRNGSLKSITLNQRVLTDMEDLHRNIVALVGSDKQLSSDAEVTIISDYDLAYEHVIAAITAVSGTLDDQGKVIKLVEKIHLADAHPVHARG